MDKVLMAFSLQSKQPEQSSEIDRLFTPRWTFGSVVMAGAVTVGIYLLLPFLERFSARPTETRVLRRVDAIVLPPPPPLPPPPEPKAAAARPKAPKPELEPVPRRLLPLRPAINLGVSMDVSVGDVGMDFHFPAAVIEEPAQKTFFELGDLDEPPRPLVQIKPVYPPQARMRRIEGEVVLEFIVAADGIAREIRVVSAQPTDVFNESAVRAAASWRFSPGTLDGKPVAVRVQQRVEFSLH